MQLVVKIVWIPLALPKFSPYQNGEFLLHRKLYATEIKVDYSTQIFATAVHGQVPWFADDTMMY